MKLINAQHRPWLIYVACSLVSLAVMTSNLQGGLVANRIEATVLNLLTPLYASINWTFDYGCGIWNNYIFLLNLRQENDRLNQELRQIRENMASVQAEARSAQRLRSLIVQSCRMPGTTVRSHVVRRANSL
ncbi:hypothetical protein JXA80_09775, partial [bacterium]|nr:hypothetical protein [candidate division CSSED10-310 bacterium]